MMKIYRYKDSGIAALAAEEFSKFYEKALGTPLPSTRTPENGCDLVIIGSDMDCLFVHELIMKGAIRGGFRFRTASDEFQILSVPEENRTILIIAGGRPRTLMYGVYRFFELRAGAAYFWDGDIVEQRESLDITGMDIYEKPHFQYRGLSYCPHRSLHRFQAEQWDYEDWTREIDWILKKRFNLFWMRLGLDDLFLKAFPDVVHAHGYDVPEAPRRSYDDRRLFWSLEYRGELRRKVLKYARERDLLHPEDSGTFTHWDTRTPQEFIDKMNPGFMPQASSGMGEPSGLVWDIRKDENLDNYFKITEAHIKNYGSPDLFFTRGASERSFYKDRRQNLQMKIYAYRRILDRLRKLYPNAPLIIEGWDFMVSGEPMEVRKILSSLEDKNTMILDFTTDIQAGDHNFMSWALPRNFPWIFAFFSGNEPYTEIRGNYAYLEQRLPVAAADPMCRGFCLWPESSHTDPFLHEYLSMNAWNPDYADAESFIDTFCPRRYRKHCAEMTEIWRRALPVIRSRVLGYRDIIGRSSREYMMPLNVLWVFDIYHLRIYREGYKHFEKTAEEIAPVFVLLGKMAGKENSEMTLRDIIDLGKSLCASLMNYSFSAFLLLMENFRNGDAELRTLEEYSQNLLDTMTCFRNLLASHEEHSLYDSLLLLGKNHECNPDFEPVLKGNAENDYCRSFITELFDACYIPEMKALLEWVLDEARKGHPGQWKRPEELFKKRQAEIRERFYSTPLSEYAPDVEKYRKLLPETLEKLSVTAEKAIMPNLTR